MSKQKLITCSELRKKDSKTLIKMLKELELSKSQDTMAMVSKRAKNTNLLKKSRKTIARVKTVLWEKRELAKLEVKKAKTK